MANKVVKLRNAADGRAIDSDAVLNALSTVVVAVDEESAILYVNSAGEQFFQGSELSLRGKKLGSLLPEDSPLFELINQARTGGYSVAEYRVPLNSPRVGNHVVNVQAAPLVEVPGAVVVSMQELSLAAKIERQLSHRGAARSVSAMAAMLAHEIKNPLAGIRGASQLLEQSVEAEDRKLTRLICVETDRVCALVDRMEMFSAEAPLRREPVNIHEVLGRVRMLVESGAGKRLSYVENYDPSLPPVYGDRDQLVQVFLNLLKNAVEAVPRGRGEVVITTAYRHGVRFAVSGGQSGVHLPLMILIQDNGEGVPEDLKPHLFEPFVSSKPAGKGLGLALVAKIIDDHGGVIEFESQPKRTVFRVMLPMYAPPRERP